MNHANCWHLLRLIKKRTTSLASLLTLLLISSCSGQLDRTNSNSEGFEVKFLVGSDLAQFCTSAAARLNQTKPKVSSGENYYLSCEAKGSGDVVQDILNLAQQWKSGNITPEAADFPTLLAVDGEIYQSQLVYQMNKLFPGQEYIPNITDSPLIAYSPMVFMTTEQLAPGLEQSDNLYITLAETENHQQLDQNAPAIPLSYVHTAPTRSNSGLQTLVAQFASIANKQPEDLTLADVKQHQEQVKQIQNKITRYGKSTGNLARSMTKNGVFWASVGSVYESLVITANSQPDNNQTKYQAVYPDATFSSNMRAMLPNAPWVSSIEREAAKEVIEYLRSPKIQAIATDLGLRPGVPGVALGNKFSALYGVNPQPQYDSYRPPQPEVVEAMLNSWQTYAKKPSLVAVVIDTSGSMQGTKLAAIKNTLLNYIQNLGERERIALISFNSEINPPVIIEGTQAGKNKGIEFISQLQANGGTRLYDSSLYARDWLMQNSRADAINAVLILTDGEDSGSQINLDQLSQKLKTSNFESGENIAFFTVGYGQAGQFNPEALQKIAELNGGYYRQGDPQTISNLMADLQVEF
ncbi:MAG: extracellular solute-binding protein [Cyanobacteria bacterium P01_G01_bin.39]